jgi:hypothetical protein
MSFNSKYTGQEVEDLLDQVANGNTGGEGGGGGEVSVEGFIPLSRDFSDDFNDDFAR